MLSRFPTALIFAWYVDGSALRDVITTIALVSARQHVSIFFPLGRAPQGWFIHRQHISGEEQGGGASAEQGGGASAMCMQLLPRIVSATEVGTSLSTIKEAILRLSISVR